MPKMVPLPWTPGQAPKVHAAKRQATSIGALAALEKMHDRECELTHINRLRALGGCATILISCTVMPLCMKEILQLSVKLHPDGAGLSGNPIAIGLGMDGILLLFTIPFAI